MNVKQTLQDGTIIMNNPSEIFKEEITCRLPYRIYQRPAPPELASESARFIMGDGLIIGVTVIEPNKYHLQLFS